MDLLSSEVAVISTSLKVALASFNEIDNSAEQSLIACLNNSYPTYVTITWIAPVHSIENSPFISLVVPFFSPMRMLAPCKGEPVLASTTLPFSVGVCPQAPMEIAHSKILYKFFFIYIKKNKMKMKESSPSTDCKIYSLMNNKAMPSNKGAGLKGFKG